MARGEHKSYRNTVCEIQTRLYDDDGNQIFDPATFERFVEANARGIVRACYRIHAKDTYTLDDCYRDPKTDQPLEKPADGAPPEWARDEEGDPHYVGKGYLGDRKPIHFHGPIEFTNARSYEALAKQFGFKDSRCIQKPTGRYEGELYGHKFDGMATYVTHKADDQQAMGKHLYSDDEVWTYNYDYTTETAEYLRLRAKASVKRMKKAEIDMYINKVHDGEMSIAEVRSKFGYAFYHDHKRAFDDARSEYLMSDDFSVPMRTSIYIGPTDEYAKSHPKQAGGLGKTQLAKRIAMGLSPETPQQHDSFHKVVDLKVSFDRYIEQPTIIFSESRPGGFMGVLGREKTFAILDPHPDKDAVNVKYGDKVLVNRFNIVEGIQPWKVFLDGLAGAYVDRNGEHHEAEAITQAYRRFALVIGLTPTTFDLYGNKGVFTGDDSQLTTFMHLAHGNVNVAYLMRTYGGEALAEVFKPIVKAVVDAVNKLVAMQAARHESIDEIVEDDVPILEFYEQGMCKEYDALHPGGWYPGEIRSRCESAMSRFDQLAGNIGGIDALDEGSISALAGMRDALFDVCRESDEFAIAYEEIAAVYDDVQSYIDTVVGKGTDLAERSAYARDEWERAALSKTSLLSKMLRGLSISALLRAGDDVLHVGGVEIPGVARAFDTLISVARSMGVERVNDEVPFAVGPTGQANITRCADQVTNVAGEFAESPQTLLIYKAGISFIRVYPDESGKAHYVHAT